MLAAMNRLDLCRARTPEEWRAVRTLRFDGLAARAEIAPSAERSFVDEFDAAPSTTAYLLTAAAAMRWAAPC